MRGKLESIKEEDMSCQVHNVPEENRFGLNFTFQFVYSFPLDYSLLSRTPLRLADPSGYLFLSTSSKSTDM